MNCMICAGREWQELPAPAINQSVTTAGVIIPEPLQREQCMSCGLLQKKDQRFVGHGPFYEERYQTYYERPGAERFDRSRYVAMAEWMRSALGDDFVPRSILDVGCGAGWSMECVRRIYPQARLEGIEPSNVNAEKARQAGFIVLSMRFGDGAALSGPYDLIYANNVLQHVTDAAGFFRDLATNLCLDGRAVMILPDATEASNEMLWSDHNFSFRPTDLLALAGNAGLRVLNWQPNPPNNALLDKQIVVLGKSGGASFDTAKLRPSLPLDTLFQQRSSYMMNWQGLDAYLVERSARHERVFNFGASTWSWLLAGYCPGYWNLVRDCLVDGESGRCMEKHVVSPSGVQFLESDCIVLGVNPASQAGLRDRLSHLASEVVTWADKIGS